jgi:hypothetical protein
MICATKPMRNHGEHGGHRGNAEPRRSLHALRPAAQDRRMRRGFQPAPGDEPTRVKRRSFSLSSLDQSLTARDIFIVRYKFVGIHIDRFLVFHRARAWGRQCADARNSPGL